MKRQLVSFTIQIAGAVAHKFARALLEKEQSFSVNLGMGSTKRFIFTDRCLLTNGVAETFETPLEARNRVEDLVRQCAGKRAYFHVAAECDGAPVLASVALERRS